MRFSKDMLARAPDVAAQLKLISNPNRLLIVCRLLDGEMSVGDIETELEIRQPTLSRELGHLRDAGIITPRRQSKVVFYSLTHDPMRRLIEAICETTAGRRAKPPQESKSINQNTDKVDFNPRPKFGPSATSSPEGRGYSVFASVKHKGA